jgi:hypothetical protein
VSQDCFLGVGPPNVAESGPSRRPNLTFCQDYGWFSSTQPPHRRAISPSYAGRETFDQCRVVTYSSAFRPIAQLSITSASTLDADRKTRNLSPSHPTDEVNSVQEGAPKTSVLSSTTDGGWIALETERRQSEEGTCPIHFRGHFTAVSMGSFPHSAERRDSSRRTHSVGSLASSTPARMDVRESREPCGEPEGRIIRRLTLSPQLPNLPGDTRRRLRLHGATERRSYHR